MQEISVKTMFGTLVAQVGGDEDFPEILVFLRNEKGNELMLAAVTDNSILAKECLRERPELRLALYSNTKQEDWTQGHRLYTEDIFSQDAMWM